MSDFQAPPPPQGQQQPTYVLPHSEPSNPGTKIAILFGAVIALLAANIYLFTQINGLKTQVTQNQTELMAQIGNLQATSSANTAAARKNLESLQDEVEAARRQASMAVGQAKIDATKHAEELARKLEQQQKAADAAVRTEISKVETTANTKIGAVSDEVTSVKTEVTNTKSELEKTIDSLKSTRGDLGVQSGLIATNSKELAALKALGERNYFEFNLAKAKNPQRVGDILVKLKKTDTKRNRYTVEITADDKLTEKKDKTINEPVQFYTSKARQPYEFVVNEVKKDIIVGYLSTPKVQIAR